MTQLNSTPSNIVALHTASDREIPSREPEISVVLAAHNTGAAIEGCLQAIADQDYPMERVEIVLVDDRCTDDTVERVLAMDLPRLRVVHIEQPHPTLSTRQAALDLGIREAHGEIVMLTDAGGRVPRDWIRELTGHLSHRDGAVTAPVVYAGKVPLIGGLMTVNGLFLFTLFRWSSHFGWKTGIFGANTAMWRDAYLKLGGFEAIGFSLGEDQALGNALKRHGYSLRFLNTPPAQIPAMENIGQAFSRLRCRASVPRSAASVILHLIILSNILMTAAGVVLGGGWLILLAARYFFGLFFLGTTFGQYRNSHGPGWVWFYDPLLTVFGPLIMLSNLVRPRWSLDDLSYGAKGPILPASEPERTT